MKKKVLMAALLVAGMSFNVLAQKTITESNTTGVANMHYLSMNYFKPSSSSSYVYSDFINCYDQTVSPYNVKFKVDRYGNAVAHSLYLYSSSSYGTPNDARLFINKKEGGFSMTLDGYMGYKPLWIYTSELNVEGKINCKNELNVTQIKTEDIKTETIRTSDITVDMNNAADYVFDENYNLQDLSEVEAYVKENKHLPGVPSAADMAENGMSVSQMSNLLLEKIEELTLHMIELQKENKALKERIESLEK